MAADLLAVAAGCLEGTVKGTPTDSLNSHGSNYLPRAPDCDHLEVRVASIAPTRSFPTPFSGYVQACADVSRSVTFVIHLRRKCYPRLDNAGKFPPAADVTVASLELADDANQLWCCVLGAYQAGDLFVDPAIPDEPLPLVPGTMVPFRAADIGGWDWPLTVGLDPCCYTSGASGS